MEINGNKSRKGGFSALISIEGQVYKGEDQKEIRRRLECKRKRQTSEDKREKEASIK